MTNELTFLLDHELDEALLIEAFGNNVDEDIILFPHAVNLVVLVFYDSTFSMPCHTVLDILLLSNILLVSVSESCSKIVEHYC